jgi:hypothetical protein
MRTGSRTKRVMEIEVSGDPVRRIERLPWPRSDRDKDTGELIPRGVDVEAKRQDIVKIVHKYFKVPGVPMEELMQEVFLAIIHKNHGRSAHNPKKSSFGHYVYMVANNVCINLVHRKRRFERERDSIDTGPHPDDDRPFLETYEAVDEKEDTAFTSRMDEVEAIMRQEGMWDLARYIRAVRSGASSDVIREALSFGERRITNKTMREIRHQVREAVREMAVATA